MGSKKKKSTIGYWYRLGVQIAVAHAPVDKITQLIFGERTGWTGSVQDGNIQIDNLNLFGGEKREGGVKGNVSVHSGIDTQPIDPYVATMRGDTSAQRGLLTLVFGSSGKANASQLRAINFNMSTMSEAAEKKLGYQPYGILTSTNQQVTKEQAYSYIAGFYPDIAPYQEDVDEDRNGNGSKNEYVEPIEDQKKIYGSYRAVALMFAYRAFVLGNLIRNPKVRMTSSEFFGNEVRDTLVDRKYTQPFYWCAMNPYFKSVWVRVQSIFGGWSSGVWYKEKASIKGTDHIADNKARIECYDMNPAHIIYKILTNTTWGMGYNPSDLDDASFRKAADGLYDEKFGISIAWRSEETIEDFIGKILDTIDGALRINVITGKFELILIRNDYDVSKLPVLDEGNIIEIESFERSSWGDSPNEVVLTYKDRNEDNAVVTVQNLSTIEIQGNVISSSQSYDGIHEAELAARVAQRELQALSTPLAKINLKVNRMGFLLQHGDVFNLQWAALGITNMPCRVIAITRGEFDDGTITIEAAEDVFGMPQQTYVSSQGSLWTDTSPRTPVAVDNMKIWETPYYDVVAYAGEQPVAQSNMTEGNTFVRVLADAPSEAAMNFDLIASNSDSVNSYKVVGTSENFTSNFQLADRLNRADTAIRIAWIENKPATITDTMYIVVDDEAMAILSIDENSGVINVKRGILDTIPEIHNVGTTGWITDAHDAVDDTFRAQNDKVFYRALTNTTRGQLPYSDSVPFSTTLVGRPYRPFPPANVSLNGNNAFPSALNRAQSLTVSWVGRNRKLANKSYDWTAGHITPESGVTYNVRIYNPETGKDFYNDMGLTVFYKTYLAPKTLFKFTLPTTISGLVYHFDFEAAPVNNQYAPVAGGNSGKATVTNAPQVTGALSNTKALEFGTRRYARLPFDDVFNKKSFALGFRIKLTGDYQYPFVLKDANSNMLSFVCAISGSSIYAYFASNDFSGSMFRANASFDNANSYHDVIINVNAETKYIDIWINGVLKIHQLNTPLPDMGIYNPAGARNLFVYQNASFGLVDGRGQTSTSETNYRTSDYIAVEAGQTYTYQLWRRNGYSSAETAYMFFDAAKRPVSSRTRVTTSNIVNGMMYQKMNITAPANAAYIRIGSRELTNGYAMLTKGADVPAYNMAEGDFIGVKITDDAWVGTKDGGGNNYWDSTGSRIDDIFIYNRTLTDAEVKQISEAMVKQAWSDKVAIEMSSMRGNIPSWQTFRHSWATTD